MAFWVASKVGCGSNGDGASNGVSACVVALPALCYNRAWTMDAFVPFSVQCTSKRRFRKIGGALAGNPKSRPSAPIPIRRDGRVP